MNQPWQFGRSSFELVIFSLVLEHIENLELIFTRTAAHLDTGGYLYIGELHPYKQYAGSQARFEKEGVTIPVKSFVHHTSSFINAAKQNGFELITLQEYADELVPAAPPRLLVLLFRKIKH